MLAGLFRASCRLELRPSGSHVHRENVLSAQRTAGPAVDGMSAMLKLRVPYRAGSAFHKHRVAGVTKAKMLQKNAAGIVGFEPDAVLRIGHTGGWRSRAADDGLADRIVVFRREDRGPVRLGRADEGSHHGDLRRGRRLEAVLDDRPAFKASRS